LITLRSELDDILHSEKIYKVLKENVSAAELVFQIEKDDQREALGLLGDDL